MSDQFEYRFDVEIKRFYFKDTNLNYYSPYCWNGFKVIDESSSGIFSWGKESFGRKIGHDWQTADESTHVGNNGYDILMSVSGRSRRYFWDVRGAAGSNDAYAVGGAGYKWNLGACINDWNINSWIWDNHVQHETSHLFGPGDTETSSFNDSTGNTCNLLSASWKSNSHRSTPFLLYMLMNSVLSGLSSKLSSFLPPRRPVTTKSSFSMR